MSVTETRLFIALYTDADVSLKLTQQLRARGYDAVSAIELGRYQPLDQEQLDYAIAEHRAIFTFNIKHFKTLFDSYWNASREHYGVIVSN